MATSNQERKLEGMTVVITGKLEGMTRYDAESMVQNHGGKPSSSVTKGTNLLVVGEKPGSKLTKAKQLGIRVMTQGEFTNFLKG